MRAPHSRSLFTRDKLSETLVLPSGLWLSSNPHIGIAMVPIKSRGCPSGSRLAGRVHIIRSADATSES